MRSAYAIPRISTSSSALATVNADLLIVPVHEGEASVAFDQVDRACGGDLRAAMTRGEFHPKVGEHLPIRVQATDWTTGHVLAVGAGRADEVETARRVGASAIAAARGLRRPTVA